VSRRQGLAAASRRSLMQRPERATPCEPRRIEW
jgi:hypothetical protein